MAVEALIEKIRTLSPEKAAEVEDFVDFLRTRDGASVVAEAFRRVLEVASERCLSCEVTAIKMRSGRCSW